jgi:glycosyltransferase involved in cell wall biosynthesis
MVVAVARVKDEADIVEATVRRMLRQVDHVIVADNASTDGTRDILERLPVELIDDPEVGYYQSAAMTGLALRAAAQGAEWVVPFDADEVWLPMHRGRIADVLGRLDDCVLVVEAPLFDHVPTGTTRPTATPSPGSAGAAPRCARSARSRRAPGRA